MTMVVKADRIRDSLSIRQWRAVTTVMDYIAHMPGIARDAPPTLVAYPLPIATDDVVFNDDLRDILVHVQSGEFQRFIRVSVDGIGSQAFITNTSDTTADLYSLSDFDTDYNRYRLNDMKEFPQVANRVNHV